MRKIFLTAVLTLALCLPTGAASAMGLIDVSNPAGGSQVGWTFSNNVFTVTGDVLITGTTTTNRVVVASGADVNILFNGVNINYPGWGIWQPGALHILPGAAVDLTLIGSNELSGPTGLQVPQGATLTINGSGSLTATGHGGGADIGGGLGGDGGFINIEGNAVVTAINNGISSAGINGRVIIEGSAVVTASKTKCRGKN